jgi:hypothetical protein
MTDPGAVVVYVRCCGMAVIVVKSGCRVGDCAMSGRWTMLGNESATDGVAAAMLRQSGKREDHDCQCQNGSGQNREERFHRDLRR